MSERISCPHCGDRIRVGAASSGRSRVVCPSCKGRFVVGDREDDRPRRRRKSRSASRGMGLWIGVGIGGAAAVVLLVGGVVAFLLLRGGPGPGGLGLGGGGDGRGSREGGGGVPAEMIAYLPNDTFRIEYTDVKAQRQAFGNDRSRIQVGGAKVEDLQRDFGSLDNVEGVLQGMRSGNFTRGQNVLVVRCSGPIDRARLTAGGKEMEVSGKKYYEMKPNKDVEGFGGKVFGDYLHFPADNLLVRADTRALMTDVIGGGGQLPEPLKGLLAECDGHLNVVSKEKGGPAVAGLTSTTWAGDRVSLRFVVEYVNEQEAANGRTYYDDLARKPRHPDARMTVSVSGRRVTAEGSGPAAALAHGW